MSNFYRQLQKRNVLKAAISYVVISWAFLQAADIIFPLLNISDGVLRFILLFLVILFPIWVVFAYFFEWTEQGFKLTSQVAEEKSLSKTTSRRLNQYIIGGLSIAVILLLTDRFTNFTGTMPSKEKERSIAVLPFDNLGDPETSYFAEGMAEDILTQLSKVANLRVLSRVTLKGYDPEGKTVEEIGDELGVNYLLTGSVRKANDQVRVNCQLVQVKPEEQAWAENFDRQLNDIFRIQSEVAQNIAGQLQATLTPAEQRRIELEPTQNLEAYTLYLKGREAYGKYTSTSMKEALEYFKQAITEDPNLALAYAGLADTYGQLTSFDVLPRNYFDTGLYYGRKSVEINPELAEGWKAIGLYYHYTGDLPNAQKNYEKALSYNSNYHPAVANLGPVYGMQGMFDQAMEVSARSIQLDPLNGFSYANLADGLKYMGLYDSALSIIQMGIDVDPVNTTYRIKSDILIEMGEFNLAKQGINQIIAADSADYNLIDAADKTLRIDTTLTRDFLSMVSGLDSAQGKRHWLAHSILGYLIQDADSAQGWIQGGIKHYETITQSGPANIEIFEQLIFLYAMDNQIDKAIQALIDASKVGYIYTARLKGDPRSSNLWGVPAIDSLVHEIDLWREEMRFRLTAQSGLNTSLE